MKGLDDFVHRVISALKVINIKERQRQRLSTVVGGAKAIIAVGIAVVFLFLFVTCNIDSPYTVLLTEKVNSDLQFEDEIEGARGILDESFGGDGVVTYDGDGSSVCVNGSQQLLVTGTIYNGSDYDMSIWSYLENGSLDESFGYGGNVTHHNAASGNGSDSGASICLDSNGRILVTGNSFNGIDKDMVLWRYLRNGILDTEFGNSGVVTHHNAAGGGENDYGRSVCIDDSGRILVAGYSDNVSNEDMVLWRYLENGSLDVSFDGDGFVTHDNAAGGGSSDEGQSVCVDGSGRVLVAGYSYNDNDRDMTLWRYLEDGSLDTSFDGDGVVTHHNAAGGDGWDEGNSVCVDESGRILVAGYSNNVSNEDMVLWRYLEDGSLDVSFDGDGVVTHHNAAGGDRWDEGESVCVDGSGRFIVTGFSYNDGFYPNMALWCYLGSGILDSSFGDNGIVTYNNSAGGSGFGAGKSVCVDGSGRIIVAGLIDNGSDYYMALWRYK